MARARCLCAATWCHVGERQRERTLAAEECSTKRDSKKHTKQTKKNKTKILTTISNKLPNSSPLLGFICLCVWTYNLSINARELQWAQGGFTLSLHSTHFKTCTVMTNLECKVSNKTISTKAYHQNHNYELKPEVPPLLAFGLTLEFSKRKGESAQTT